MIKQSVKTLDSKKSRHPLNVSPSLDSFHWNAWAGEPGFSLLEALIVMVLFLLISSVAVLSMQTLRSQFQADAVGAQILGLVREARERGIAERRNYRIQFSSTHQVQLIRSNVPTGTTTIKTDNLVNGAQFQLFTGLPDTPDGFGAAEAISFGSATSLNFVSNGTFVDHTGSPLNGTVFVGVPGNSKTAHAVTILGATGKIQLYHWSGSQWLK